MCRVAIREFEATTASVPRARHWVAEKLTRWSVTEASEAAQLLVTELMSNAVRHGSGRPVVSVSVAESSVEVGVSDTGILMPRPPRHPSGDWVDVDPTSQGGRGLHIVDSLATEWGTRPLETGKCVWFLLDAADWSYNPSCACPDGSDGTVILGSGRHALSMSGPWDAG